MPNDPNRDDGNKKPQNLWEAIGQELKRQKGVRIRKEYEAWQAQQAGPSNASGLGTTESFGGPNQPPSLILSGFLLSAVLGRVGWLAIKKRKEGEIAANQQAAATAATAALNQERERRFKELQEQVKAADERAGAADDRLTAEQRRNDSQTQAHHQQIMSSSSNITAVTGVLADVVVKPIEQIVGGTVTTINQQLAQTGSTLSSAQNKAIVTGDTELLGSALQMSGAYTDHMITQVERVVNLLPGAARQGVPTPSNAYQAPQPTSNRAGQATLPARPFFGSNFGSQASETSSTAPILPGSEALGSRDGSRKGFETPLSRRHSVTDEKTIQGMIRDFLTNGAFGMGSESLGIEQETIQAMIQDYVYTGAFAANFEYSVRDRQIQDIIRDFLDKGKFTPRRPNPDEACHVSEPDPTDKRGDQGGSGTGFASNPGLSPTGGPVLSSGVSPVGHTAQATSTQQQEQQSARSFVFVVYPLTQSSTCGNYTCFSFNPETSSSISDIFIIQAKRLGSLDKLNLGPAFFNKSDFHCGFSITKKTFLKPTVLNLNSFKTLNQNDLEDALTKDSLTNNFLLKTCEPNPDQFIYISNNNSQVIGSQNRPILQSSDFSQKVPIKIHTLKDLESPPLLDPFLNIDSNATKPEFLENPISITKTTLPSQTSSKFFIGEYHFARTENSGPFLSAPTVKNENLNLSIPFEAFQGESHILCAKEDSHLCLADNSFSKKGLLLHRYTVWETNKLPFPKKNWGVNSGEMEIEIKAVSLDSSLAPTVQGEIQEDALHSNMAQLLSTLGVFTVFDFTGQHLLDCRKKNTVTPQAVLLVVGGLSLAVGSPEVTGYYVLGRLLSPFIIQGHAFFYNSFFKVNETKF
uniref:Uncharacterized protein n=1 Tax=Hazenia capsulata TaxID=2202518 RepID=A0A1W6EHQ8_9CHLO|nr:hypothetical protein CCM22_pgp055 [Hazenia capsulata]ARK14906.1 hypothetical protein [Hazenia capsulata]